MNQRRTAGSGAANLRRTAGFTLVEVLIALLLMAILTGLAWQAMDGILRARDASRDSIDRSTRLSTVLVQWEQDLLALYDTEQVPPLTFDGQTLRLTRRTDAGVSLVAWSVRDGRWQRWESPVAVRSAELGQTWLRSQQLLGNEPGHVLLAEGASQWQIYFHRGGQWSNPQSTGNLAPQAASLGASAPTPPPREQLPDALRLQVTLDGKVLTRDIALGPS